MACGRCRNVSIHAPARGATSRAEIVRFLILFQSTLPRGERRLALIKGQVLEVSIHAPARGATPDHGPDQISGDVSIHAPARGATAIAPMPGCRFSCFNPRSRAGSDPLLHCVQVSTVLFQSTLPRGERPPASAGCRPRPGSFNPRSRAGSDATTVFTSTSSARVSIHAPARGATPFVGIHSTAPSWFQSTLPRGERPPLRGKFARRSGFNPRSRAGSDSGVSANSRPPILFQSTLPRGERPPRSAGYPRQGPGFNPRSRAGSDVERLGNEAGVAMFQSTLPRGERRLASSL